MDAEAPKDTFSGLYLVSGSSQDDMEAAIRFRMAEIEHDLTRTAPETATSVVIGAADLLARIAATCPAHGRRRYVEAGNFMALRTMLEIESRAAPGLIVVADRTPGIHHCGESQLSLEAVGTGHAVVLPVLAKSTQEVVDEYLGKELNMVEVSSILGLRRADHCGDGVISSLVLGPEWRERMLTRRAKALSAVRGRR